jgi:hypothetical protein
MNEQECAVAYQELVEILNHFRLEWLVERVADAARRGKTVILQDNGQQSSHLTVEPLTNQEQLFLLIDAVEQALVETAAMEVEISDFLREENLEPKITTSDGQQETVHDYRPEIVYSRKENADVLKKLLEELRSSALAHVH